MNNFFRMGTGVLLMATVLSGCEHDTGFSDFNAVTVKRSGTFELDMTPDDAFPLFTAPGERLWAPGWEPHILSGDGFEEGTVWVTESHGHTGYWYVADYDTVARHARYVRVTPGADAGTVDVSLKPSGAGGSKVRVTYQLTALSEAGNQHLSESFSELKYAEMMKHWQSLIEDSRDRIDAHFGH
jgi:hypothetical protein